MHRSAIRPTILYPIKAPLLVCPRAFSLCLLPCAMHMHFRPSVAGVQFNACSILDAGYRGSKVSSTNVLMQSYTVFDFLPADATALRTTATLMAGGSVKGILRERQLRRLPRRRCSLIGEATVPEVICQVPCAYLVSPMAAGCAAESLHVFHCNCSALHCIFVSQSGLRLCFCASGYQLFSGMYLQARLVLCFK